MGYSRVDRYSSFWLRVLAKIIDGLVFAPINVTGHFYLVPGRGRAFLYTWNVFIISAFWLYSALMHAKYGQTLGKKAMNVKVLDVSEERIPSLSQAFLREIGGIVISVMWLTQLTYFEVIGRFAAGTHIGGIPSQILNAVWIWWLVAELVTMVANSKRRALHDYIAGTVVVRNL
jgi:uncharacterized RDD family membrane protein YckC